MQARKTVYLSCLLVLLTAGFLAGQAVEPAAAAPAAPMIELGCAARKKVVEASKSIEMRYALTVGRDKTATIVRPPVPLAWKITDAKGAVVLEVEPGKVAGVTRLDGRATITSGVFAEENILPREQWPAGVLRVEASYAATAEMYKSLGVEAAADAFMGAVTSKPVEVVVKPDGWKEETYMRYARALERMLKSKLRPLAFEFPELRNLEDVTIAMAPEGAIGRFRLEREYLEIMKDQDPPARLRKANGYLEFVARDPLARRDLPSDLQGLVEDGLVLIEFRYDMTTNKWLAGRLPSVEEVILNDLKAKGTAAAESYEVPQQLAVPPMVMPSTEDMLRTPHPEIPQ